MIGNQLRELVTYYSKYNHKFAMHDHNNVFIKAMKDLESGGFKEMEGAQVLDLGCGSRYSLALQCASRGASVTALDVNYVKPEPLPVAFVKIWRHNGLKRALKTSLRRVVFDKQYYKVLEQAVGRRLSPLRSKINFVIAKTEDAEYPLISESFDLILSNAVIEHLFDVKKFVAEIKRLLKPNGYFYAIIHNYYSLSGGHNMEWAYPDEEPSLKVPPWDHLREASFPTDVFLNELRPEQYYEAFAEHMNIVQFEERDINHDSGGLEGERFLTSEIEKELPDYPRNLLLTRSWCLIAKKHNDN